MNVLEAEAVTNNPRGLFSGIPLTDQSMAPLRKELPGLQLEPLYYRDLVKLH
jgi:hypothetical protein